MDPFDQYPISTQTLIISTNVTIDCAKYYAHIQCPEVSKPASGKTRMHVNESDNLPEGTIVFAQYKQDHKGTAFKKISDKYFLNSVTIIMRIHTKYINIKVSNKGKLQITGCNQNTYAISILKHFWRHLSPEHHTIWEFHDPEHTRAFEALVVPVMCNINFAIPFQINRESLNNIINTQTSYVSILEPSDGYVGVNIKISMQEEPLEQILIDQYTYLEGEWVLSKTRFMDYILTLSPKEQKKKMAKCYVNTFLVFYSGKVIMSGGISHINRKRAYEKFMEIVHQHQQSIRAPLSSGPPTPECDTTTSHTLPGKLPGTFEDPSLVDRA
jgi:TATA-box binding protein (TBP) (component of TFIID and TFIIIB)